MLENGSLSKLLQTYFPVQSANYVRTELPIRIAHRIRDMQALPYVVVRQEMVAKVYELYWDAFEKIRNYPPITNLDENKKFCEFIQGLLNQHSPVIPNLALGLSLTSSYLTPDDLDSFFRRMLVSRISRRVICEHHIALSDTLAGRHPDGTKGHVGVIYNEIKIKDTIERCVKMLKQRPRDMADDEELKSMGARKGAEENWPTFKIDGHLDTKVSYIKEHLEYIIFEIFKNAARFSMLRRAHGDVPPVIRTTIVSGDEDILIRVSDQGGGVTPEINSTADLFSFSHVRNSTRLAKDRLSALRDASLRERGFTGTIAEQLNEKAQKEAAKKKATEPFVRRIGFGLPLSNIFATYFGGSLELISLEGWGLDVYIRLPRLGTNLEGIETRVANNPQAKYLPSAQIQTKDTDRMRSATKKAQGKEKKAPARDDKPVGIAFYACDWISCEPEHPIQPPAQADASGEKPKFFPLFYKKPKADEATTSGGDDPPNVTRTPMQLDDVDPVSSPPQGMSFLPMDKASEPSIPPTPAGDDTDMSALHSIFSLPVPTLKTKESAGSLQKKSSASSSKSRRPSTTKRKSPSSIAPTPPSKSPRLGPEKDATSTRKASPLSNPPEVIHLSDEDEEPVPAKSQPGSSNAQPNAAASPLAPVAGPPQPPKPTHPFFAPRKAKDAPTAPAAEVNITSSPVAGPPRSPKPTHPFFAPRKAKDPPTAPAPEVHIIIDDDSMTGSHRDPIRISSPPDSPVIVRSRPPPAKKRRLEPKDAPWPSAEFQHVKGLDVERDVSLSSLPFDRRIPSSSTVSRTESTLKTALPPLPPRELPPQQVSAAPELDQRSIESALLSIPQSHLRLPAFSPLVKHLYSGERLGDQVDPWTDRWRPRKARHVLGNEENAQYLKTWLRTLELGNETVVTAVPQAQGQGDSIGSSPPGKRKGKGKAKAETLKVPKRPVVVRKVERVRPVKRKKRKNGWGSDDDWIVSDDEADFNYPQEEGDEPQPLRFRPSVSPCKPRADSQRPYGLHLLDGDSDEEGDTPKPIFSPLTNSILLSGPPGSGKTAAIYACAEELGWEVYEVYPGMGKRSGTNLSAIVDGVCKNHVIGVGMPVNSSKAMPPSPKKSVGNRMGEKAGLKNFFKRPRGDEEEGGAPNGSQGEPIVLDDHAAPDKVNSHVANVAELVLESVHENDRGDKGVQIQQSLILLEEVDILFAEDKNFWPTVVDLIAASRRPVVMTCNDPSLVPCEDLPLQATLAFEPASVAVMTSYIRCLALAIGKVVPEQTAREITEGSRYRPIAADLPDQPVHPLPYQEPPVIDLRRAIQQLQFSCGETVSPVAPEGWTDSVCDWARSDDQDDGGEEPKPGKELSSLWRFMDLVSVADAHMNRRPSRELEALSIDRYQDGPDDEIGHRILRKWPSSEDDAGTFYAKDEEITLESLAVARGYLQQKGLGAFYRRGTCRELDNEVHSDKLLSRTSFDCEWLYKARADHQRLLVGFLDELLVTPDVPLLPRPAMILDYVPYVQEMVRVDDELDALARSMREGDAEDLMGVFSSRRRGVAQRQSLRIGARVPPTHERYISLGADGLHAARESRLVV
ncbi:hypothetical protein FRC00_002804 [Tulasnella sp. 408]|nr:hypothetical protein FRC00_002804 [Tulasnella sp. 408]